MKIQSFFKITNRFYTTLTTGYYSHYLITQPNAKLNHSSNGIVAIYFTELVIQ